jgi:outer membrane protein assembly factor BamB
MRGKLRVNHRRDTRDKGSEKVLSVVRPALIGVTCLLLAGLAAWALVAAFSSSAGSSPLSDTGYPNGDLQNRRDAGGPIDAANVADLHKTWTLPVSGTGEFGAYASTPIVSKGVIYSQDLASNVEAIALPSGKVLWTRSYEQADHGPNGLVVAAGRVYGTTPTGVFALDERSGKQDWFGTLSPNGEPAIDMAPGYHAGVVYASTVPGDAHAPGKGANAGVLWALDAATGRRLWRFDTVPENLWSKRPNSENWGGGVWYTPAFDNRGFMYFGVANPEPAPGSPDHPWASSRPGRDLYTDSLVKLNAKTGKLQWYYQLTPHDIYDWDLQDPPVLATVAGRPAVITAGKAGIVIALDRETGRLLWERDVGVHNHHDHDSLFAMRGEYSRLRLPETVYPGRLGGVIAPMASDGITVFAPVVNIPQSISKTFAVSEPRQTSGEVVAIDATNGHIRWDDRFSSPVFGGVTLANNVVFASTFEGVLYGLNARTGALLWQSRLSAGSNSGIAVAGDMLVVPAGARVAEGQETTLTAYGLAAHR